MSTGIPSASYLRGFGVPSFMTLGADHCSAKSPDLSLSCMGSAGERHCSRTGNT